MEYPKSKPKLYECCRCGHQQMIATNHYGQCWSTKGWNECPKCPPWAKKAKYGGQTVWFCVEDPPEEVSE